MTRAGLEINWPIGLAFLKQRAINAVVNIKRGMNMAKKGNRELIKLESPLGTGYFYVTVKNKKVTKDKLELIKYDPKARKRVQFKEVKLK